MATTLPLPRTRTTTQTLAMVAVALHLAITLPLAYVLNVWQDDAYTLHTTARGIMYAFHQALSFEQNPPLYFVLMTLWRHIDASAFFARLFSVLCAAAVVALTPSLTKRYVPAIPEGFVLFAVTFNPLLIWAALEIRVYALVILLAALLLLTGWDAFFRDRPSRAAACWYAVCVAVALYTQYYLAFLVAAQGLTLLFYRPRALPYFITAAAIGSVAFVPMMLLLPGQIQNYRGAFAPPSLLNAGKDVAGILVRYALPLVFLTHRKIVYGGLIAAAAISAIVFRDRFRSNGNGIILAVTAFASIIFVTASYVAGVQLLIRHLAPLLLPILFVPFSIVSFLREPFRSRASAAWLCIALVSAAGTLFVTYRSGAKDGDWIRVVDYIDAHQHPSEPIAIFEAESTLPFEYYYHGPNRVIGVPRGIDFHQYDVSTFAVSSPAQIARVLPLSAQHVWFINAGDCTAANIRFGCPIVESYLHAHYRVASTARFYRSTVRLLLRLSAAKASSKR